MANSMHFVCSLLGCKMSFRKVSMAYAQNVIDLILSFTSLQNIINILFVQAPGNSRQHFVSPMICDHFQKRLWQHPTNTKVIYISKPWCPFADCKQVHSRTISGFPSTQFTDYDRWSAIMLSFWDYLGCLNWTPETVLNSGWCMRWWWSYSSRTWLLNVWWVVKIDKEIFFGWLSTSDQYNEAAIALFWILNK